MKIGYARVSTLWQALRCARLAFLAYLNTSTHGASYNAFTHYGAPYLVLLIGKGREAWRISQFAIDVEAVRK